MSTTRDPRDVPIQLPDPPVGYAVLELWPDTALLPGSAYWLAARPDIDPDDAVVIGRIWLRDENGVTPGWRAKLGGDHDSRARLFGSKEQAAEALVADWTADADQFAEQFAVPEAVSDDAEHQALMGRLADACARSAVRALFRGDVEKSRMMADLGEAMEREAGTSRG